MAQPIKKIDYATRVVGMAKYSAAVTEEIGAGLIGFIPNGLDQVYDYFFKALPFVGKVFKRRWLEQVIKLCLGITIGRGLASDIARFVFWPLGFAVGALVGSASSIGSNDTPVYHGQIRKFMYKLSGFTVAGALLGTLFGWGIGRSLQILFIGMGTGATLGVIAYTMYLVALTVAIANQKQTFHRNTGIARSLGAKIRELAKQNAKGRILLCAQDIIQQMNGPDAQSYMSEFFEEAGDAIAQSCTKKIDRHLHYLTERASGGDTQALSRLQQLVRRQGDLDGLLDRIFNERTKAKIKDEVDTYFDRWFYRFLKA